MEDRVSRTVILDLQSSILGFGRGRAMDILRTLKERCDPKYAALVVVDVQNDFVSPEGSAGKRGEDVGAAMSMVPNLLRLIDQARRVGLTIVYIRTTHSEWTDTPSWIYRTSQKGGLSTCREGTWGAEFYEGISPRPPGFGRAIGPFAISRGRANQKRDSRAFSMRGSCDCR